jgi:hypothetical protein
MDTIAQSPLVQFSMQDKIKFLQSTNQKENESKVFEFNAVSSGCKQAESGQRFSAFGNKHGSTLRIRKFNESSAKKKYKPKYSVFQSSASKGANMVSSPDNKENSVSAFEKTA